MLNKIGFSGRTQCALTITFAMVAVAFGGGVYAQDKVDSGRYFPIHTGNKWYYKAFKRGEEENTKKIKAEIIGEEEKDGIQYPYFYAPGVDIRYLIRKTKEGVFVRGMKFPFPLFGFSIDVDIIPEMPMIKFPLKKGSKWEYKGKGRAYFLFIPIERDVTGKYEVIGKQTVDTGAGKIETFHIRAVISGEDDRPKLKKYWYAKDIGFAISDNSNHRAELTGFSVYSEKEGKFIENLPERVEEYK